jgi:hypothetical protein
MKLIVSDSGSAKKITVTGVSQDILDYVFGIGYNYVVVGGDEVETACEEITSDINEHLNVKG